MKPILYIHAGTEKTGTTALQNFFFDNQKELEKSGLYYPIKELANKRGVGNGNCIVHVGEQLTETEEKYIEIIKTMAKNKNVLVSHENIWRNCNVFRHLINEAYSVKVIIYLRRQDKFLESMWAFGVKAYNDYEEDIGSFCKNYKVDYLKRIDAISQIVGEENVIIRRYEEDGLCSGRSIFSDFFETIDMELNDCYLMPESKKCNPPYASETMFVKNILNGIPKVGVLNAISRQAAQSLFIQDSKEVEGVVHASAVMNKAQRMKIWESCKEENEKLEKKYFKEGSLFKYDVNEESEQFTMEDILRYTIRYFGMMIAFQQEEIQRLQRKKYKFSLIKIKQTGKIVIFGAGQYGKALRAQILEKNYCDIVGWCDSNFFRPEMDKRVMSPDKILDLDFDQVVIAMKKDSSYEEVYNYMIDLGIDKEKIVRAELV